MNEGSLPAPASGTALPGLVPMSSVMPAAVPAMRKGRSGSVWASAEENHRSAMGKIDARL